MDLLFQGLGTAMAPENLLYCFLGVLFGTALGALPGIGSLAAVALILPVTFHLDATTALIMLAGVYYGTEYGGSTASILLNLPGTPSNAITCLDGYPMAQQGRAGVALFATTLSSFFGGIVGILFLVFLTPLVISMTLAFQAAEYVGLMVFGLIAAAAVGQNSPGKGLAMVVLGLLLGCIGTDINSGAFRFTFGIIELYDGLSVVVLAMGLFGLSELIGSIRGQKDRPKVAAVSLRSMVPNREDFRQGVLPTLRGTGIGALLGPLPGTGPVLASFLSYAVEKRVARDPSKLGTGVVAGIAAPEAANNAAAQTAFIPTLAIGIPGSASMAVMLAALMIHGITPGPRLMIDHVDLFWTVVASFFVGNLILLILNIPLIGVWVRLLTIPYAIMYPAVIVLVCVGIYSINSNMFDVWAVLFFGVVGYGLRLLDFQPAPLLVGFVLGPMLEENFRRALLLSHGDYSVFLTRPISGILIVVAATLLCVMLASSFRRGAREETPGDVREHRAEDRG